MKQPKQGHALKKVQTSRRRDFIKRVFCPTCTGKQTLITSDNMKRTTASVPACVQGASVCVDMSYLSGSAFTTPMIVIFFPGRSPPRMPPQNGTACHTQDRVMRQHKKQIQTERHLLSHYQFLLLIFLRWRTPRLPERTAQISVSLWQIKHNQEVKSKPFVQKTCKLHMYGHRAEQVESKLCWKNWLMREPLPKM